MGQTIYRFGHFRVDAGAHALFRDEERLFIQEQPFQVLLALLENPGQVVTRETLRTRLWGTNTFVDFDQSLNSALRRLRLALGDSSRKPVYVETIPRIGFRFLAVVTVEGERAPAITPPKPVAPAVVAHPIPPLAIVSAAAPRRRFPAPGGVLATLTFFLGALLGFLPSHWKRTSGATSAKLGEARETSAHALQPVAPPVQAPSRQSPSTAAPNTDELEGWYHLNQRTQEDYVQARTAFEKVLTSRPENTSAMVGLGQTEILLALNGDAAEDRLSHAKGLSKQALILSPHLAAAHTVIGAVDALVDSNDAKAEQEFRAALHLDPHDSLTHLWYAVFVLMPRRQYLDAETEATTAVKEDPLSLIAHTNLGWILYSEGKREAALEQYRFVLHLKPDFVPARFRVGQLLDTQGRHDAALKEVADLSYTGGTVQHTPAHQ